MKTLGVSLKLIAIRRSVNILLIYKIKINVHFVNDNNTNQQPTAKNTLLNEILANLITPELHLASFRHNSTHYCNTSILNEQIDKTQFHDMATQRYYQTRD